MSDVRNFTPAAPAVVGPNAQGSNPMAGQVLFYSRPEPLEPQAHARLRIRPIPDPFAFAKIAHIVPLQVTEFGPASLSYPVIFVGEPRAPMAILGLKQGENLFVTEAGRYEELAYIPGFIRRYPFVLAGNGRDDQLVVCVDRDAPMVAEGGEGEPLFKDGRLGPAAEQAVKFCGDFETERRRTDEFVKTLRDLDLFEAKTATFTPTLPGGGQGEPVAMADYFAVSEEKLRDLPDAALRELHASGALRQIALHMNSMFNWERLVGRAAIRNAAASG